MNKISCIIPVFNEEERVGRVLDVVLSCNLIDEILVVDDFSLDNSRAIIDKYSKNIIQINHEKNMGKSMSIYDGIKSSSGDILLFLDSDLIDLNVENLNNLIKPILKNEADISISLRKNTPTFWKIIGLDYLSGERCFKKDILKEKIELLKDIKGFQLEVFINDIILEKKLTLKIVPWLNVISPLKRRKFGISFDFFIMGFNILSFISPLKIFYQIYNMKRQVNK